METFKRVEKAIEKIANENNVSTAYVRGNDVFRQSS